MEAVRSRLGANKVSQRRLCRVLGQSRSTHRYRRRKPDDDRRLIDELRRWCEWYPRFGSERVCGAWCLASPRKHIVDERHLLMLHRERSQIDRTEVEVDPRVAVHRPFIELPEQGGIS